MFSNTDELWYNEIVSRWMTIYIVFVQYKLIINLNWEIIYNKNSKNLAKKYETKLEGPFDWCIFNKENQYKTIRP